MRFMLPMGCWLLTLVAVGQEPTPIQEPTPPSTKADYSEISKMIRALVLKSAPKEFIDDSSWGQTTPFPPRFILRNVPRTTIKVGDRLELAHGPWKRAKVWMENPERDFFLAVTNIESTDASKHRVSLTSVAPVLIDYEFQQWVKGLMLLSVNGRARAKVRADIQCDAAVTLDVTKFPPAVTVDPKVSSLKVTIEEFTAFDPATAARPELAVDLNEQIRGALQGIVLGAEPIVRDHANKAIAEALRDGKGTFSAMKLFEAFKK